MKYAELQSYITGRTTYNLTKNTMIIMIISMKMMMIMTITMTKMMMMLIIMIIMMRSSGNYKPIS